MKEYKLTATIRITADTPSVMDEDYNEIKETTIVADSEEEANDILNDEMSDIIAEMESEGAINAGAEVETSEGEWV